MNTFGRIFRLSIFGEAHGEAVGVTMDGVRPGIPLSAADFSEDLLRRKCGGTGTSAREETDVPLFLSGWKDGRTTGAPLTLLFRNENIRAEDYDRFLAVPRPGQADYTGRLRFDGFNDPRGGGHFSGRLTLPIVAAGVVAKKMCAARIRAEIVALGGIPKDEAADLAGESPEETVPPKVSGCPTGGDERTTGDSGGETENGGWTDGPESTAEDSGGGAGDGGWTDGCGRTMNDSDGGTGDGCLTGGYERTTGDSGGETENGGRTDGPESTAEDSGGGAENGGKTATDRLLEKYPRWKRKLEEAMERRDSLGGIVECRTEGLDIGLGEPFFDSVESLLSHAVFAIPGVRGIEFGDGFAAAAMYGSQHNDPLGISGGGLSSEGEGTVGDGTGTDNPQYYTPSDISGGKLFSEGGGTTVSGRRILPEKNGAGGVNGGLTNGGPLVFRVAFKPTSSIGRPQETLNLETGRKETLEITGRHDACFALRTPVIVEAMTAIVLADLTLLSSALRNPGKRERIAGD